MAQLRVCDICMEKGLLVPSSLRTSLRGRRDVNMDLCDACAKNLEEASTVEYCRAAFKAKHGLSPSDDAIQTYLRTGSMAEIYRSE